MSVGGKKILTLLVVLGSDSGAGDREEKGRIWVDQRGMVVRQEMALPFGAKLRFERCDEAQSAEIYERLENAWQDDPPPVDENQATTSPGTETLETTGAEQ